MAPVLVTGKTDVKEVVRKDFQGSTLVLAVRIQYLKENKVLHDAVFVPAKNGWVWARKNIMDNFIPDKRYLVMARKAAAIIYEKGK